MMKRSSVLWVLIFVLSINKGTLFAQADRAGVGPNSPRRMILGQYDRTLTFPRMTGILGRKDSGALKAVQLYLAASSQGQWQGFDATGTMIVEAGGTRLEFPSVLTVESGGLSRLDLTTPSGIRSERVNGAAGSIRDESGKTEPLPVLAIASGIVPTPSTLVGAENDIRDTLIDAGIVDIEGAQFQKVTFVRPLFPKSDNSQPQAPPLITDFFFDPASHLLVKSVDSILLNSESSARHLRVITYSDYRSVSRAIIPFNYVETVDGRVVWTLQFSNVTLGPDHGADYFHF